MKTFQDMLQESQQLNEAYDNLGALKADPKMLKVFSMKGWGAGLPAQSGHVGKNSKVVNVSQKITSWKDIRKIAKNDTSVSGVALYADGDLFVLISATGFDFGSINNPVMVSSTKTAAFTDEILELIRKLSGHNPTFTKGNTGIVTNSQLVRELSTFVDDIVPVLEANGVKVTAKIVTSDLESLAIHNQRTNDKFNAPNDKLLDRQKSNSWGTGTGSLKQDLAKFKASKSVDISDKSPQEIVAWALSNPKAVCQYNGNTYKGILSSHNLADLFTKNKIIIQLSANSSAGSYGNLWIVMEIDPNNGNVSYKFHK